MKVVYQSINHCSCLWSDYNHFDDDYDDVPAWWLCVNTTINDDKDDNWWRHLCLLLKITIVLIILIKMMFLPDDCVSESLRWTLWVGLAEALWRSAMFFMSVRKFKVKLNNCSHRIEWKQRWQSGLFAQGRLQIQFHDCSPGSTIVLCFTWRRYPLSS